MDEVRLATARSPWEKVEGSSGIFRAPYKVPLNTTYSTLVALGENRYLVYSAGPGLESTLNDLVTNDAVFLLLAPTTGHYLGIDPWLTAHPRATVFASERLHRKILRKTNAPSIGSPANLSEQLPGFVKVHEPPPHFMKEVWMSVEQNETIYWLVGDAFLNFDKIEGNAIWKFLLSFYGLKPGLRLHKLFTLGLDNTAFRQWAEPLFKQPGRHVLLPCHQDVYCADDCGKRLASIVNATA